MQSHFRMTIFRKTSPYYKNNLIHARKNASNPPLSVSNKTAQWKRLDGRLFHRFVPLDSLPGRLCRSESVDLPQQRFALFLGLRVLQALLRGHIGVPMVPLFEVIVGHELVRHSHVFVRMDLRGKRSERLIACKVGDDYFCNKEKSILLRSSQSNHKSSQKFFIFY